MALAEDRYFIAIAARGHTAPPALMRLRAVVKPEYAARSLTTPDQLEIARCKQFRRCFSYRRQNLLGRIAFPAAIDAHFTGLVHDELQITPALR
jgi:hypothetical protein